MNQRKDLAIILIISVMLIGFSLKAYTQPRNIPTVDEIVSKMQTKLDLTNEQISQIYPAIGPINEDNAIAFPSGF